MESKYDVFSGYYSWQNAFCFLTNDSKYVIF